MVYERYIKRDGKVYGPYLYESKKINGKVVSNYVGGPEKKNVLDTKKRINKRYFLFFLAFLFLIVSSFFIIDYPLTGKAIFSTEEIYEMDGRLVGDLKLILNSGELIPINSKLIIYDSESSKEFYLNEILEETPIEGNFYSSTQKISGEGLGYGQEGERLVYPQVKIILNKRTTEFNEKKSSSNEFKIRNKEDKNIGNDKDKENKTTGNPKDKENKTIGNDKDKENKTVKGLTGLAVDFFKKSAGENIGKVVDYDVSISNEVIEENISFSKPYIRKIKKDESFELAYSSENVDIKEVEGYLIVSTDHIEKEKGFGEDFEGKSFEIEIGLSKLNFSTNGEDLKFLLVYANKELSSKEFENLRKYEFPLDFESFEENFSNLTILDQGVVLDSPIKMRDSIFISENSNVSYKFKNKAKNIKVYERGAYNLKKEKEKLVYSNSPLNSSESFSEVLIKGARGKLDIEYEIPGPKSKEIKKGRDKILEISSNESYGEFLAYSYTGGVSMDSIKLYKIENGEKIPISFFAYDSLFYLEEDIKNYKSSKFIYNYNQISDKVDYISWLVTESGNSTFQIVIEAISAEHLDENRSFVSNIFEEIKALDGVFSETINNSEYVRVTFEENLTSERDITLFPRIIEGNPYVEVYEIDGINVVAEFDFLKNEEYNKIYLTGLEGIQDTFDLKVLGGAVEFDHIIDPEQGSCGEISTPGYYTLNQSVESTGTCFTISVDNVTLDCDGYTINYSTGGGISTYGIYSGGNNTLIKDCVVVDGNSSSQFTNRDGIYLYESSNITLENTSIETENGAGLSLVSVEESTFFNVNSTSQSSRGVFLSGYCNFNNFTNVRAISSGSDYGFYLTGESNNNTLENILGNSTGGTGIRIHTGENNTLNNSHGFSNNSYGLQVSGNNNLIQNSNGTSVGTSGFSVSGEYNKLYDVRGYSDFELGFYLEMGHFNEFYGLTAESPVDYAMYSYLSENNTIDGCNLVSGLTDVLYLDNSNKNNISNCLVSGNATVITNFVGSSENILNNNTFSTQNGTGNLLSLDSNSENNLFYYNNFTETTGYFIDNDNETNEFNTTVGGVPQGNYYFNITSLAIYDSDSDGWGDTGSDYPLNSTTWSSFLNGLGNDWGPRTTLENIDTDAPNITFVSSTPNDGGTINDTFVYLNTTIIDESETSAWFDWDNSLIGYWSMDYTNSTHVYDNSSYGNFGAFEGSLEESNLTNAKRGQGLEFDGEGDYVNLSSLGAFSNTDPHTYSAWVYLDVSPTLYSWIINNGDLGDGTSLIIRNLEGENNNLGFFYDGGSSYVIGNTNITPNSWHHFVAIWNTTHVSLYLDGVSEGDTYVGSSWAASNNNTARLGSWTNGGYNFDGLMDEVMIFNRALSNQEVLGLYNGSRLYNNFTNLEDGTYDYKAYAIDAAGNLNITETRDVTVDTKVYCSSIGNSGSLDSAGTTYTLTENITSTGTCLTVTAANVTLDCNGYWINYSTGGTNNNYGIYTTELNTTIKNCNIIDGNWSSSETNRYGIFTYQSDYGLFLDNYVKTNKSYAVYLTDNSNYNNFTGNTFFSEISNGFYLNSNSNNTIKNNLFKSTGSYALFVGFNSYDNYFENNTIYSLNSRALRIGGGPARNNFVRNNFTGGTYALYMEDASDVTIRDCVDFVGLSGSIYQNYGVAENISIVNCSYEGSEDIVGTGSYILRKWYYQAYANYSNGTLIEGVNVTAYDNNSNIQFSELTNSSGFIPRQEVIEYNLTTSGRQYFNNYTINATLTGYVTDSNEINFSVEENKLDDFFSLEEEDILAPFVNWENPTPTDGNTINDTFVYLNTTITDQTQTSAWFDWDNSLVGYWGMDYTNSTHVYDNATKSNHFSFGGTGFGPGSQIEAKRGLGLSFDGINDYLVSEELILNDTDKLTIALWFNPTVTVPGDNRMLVELSSNSNYNTGSFYLNFQEDTGETKVRIANKGTGYTSEWNMWETSTNLQSDTWYHIVATIDRGLGENETKIYLNGVEDGETSATNNYNTTGNFGNYPFYVASRDGTQENVNAKFDELIIFKRVLTEEEVLGLYNGSRLYNNFTNLDDETYDYSAYAIDEAGNLNITENRNVTVDTKVYCSTIGNSGTLDSAGTTYTLTENITSAGNCLTVTAANVTLDCNGYWINYSTGGAVNNNAIYSDQFNTTIENCNIVDGNWTSFEDGRRGIYLNNADNGSVKNNFVNVSSSEAIVISSSDNSLVEYNDAFSDEGHGIEIYNSDYGVVRNNSANSNSLRGISLYNNNDYNLVINNTAVGYTNGIAIEYYSDNNNVTNNIANSTSSNSAIYVISNSADNVLTDNQGGGIYGVSIVSSNNTIIGEIPIGSSYDISISFAENILVKDCVNVNDLSTSSNSINVTFLNCSYSSESVDASSNLIRKWYYQAQANYSNGTVINGANITAYNNSDGIEFSTLTGVDGYTSLQEVTEYKNVGGTRTYFNNYTINASLTGYIAESNILNFTVEENKLDDFFTLEEDTTSPTITWESPTPNDGETVNDSFVYLNTTITDESETSAWFDWDNSLVGYWGFDYHNEAGVYDNSSYENFGNFNGGLSLSNITQGYRGSALEFSEYNTLSVNYDPIFNFDDMMTISSWIYVEDVPGTEDIILAREFTGDSLPYLFAVNPSGYLWLRSSPISQKTATSTRVIPYDTWTHVAVTFNKDSGETIFYINGEPENPLYNIDFLSNSTTSTQNIVIGDYYGHTFRGILDEVMLFHRTLSPEEINATYNSEIYGLKNNFTNLADGIYDYKAYAMDSSGNLNITETRNVTVDTTTYCTTVGNSGTLDSAGTTYTLTENITSTGTCLTVTADNVTLDCNGYWINYSTGGAADTYGFTTGQFNTTIKNCNVVDGNWSSFEDTRHGIRFYNGLGEGNIIDNNVTISNSRGIYLYNSHNNTLEGNIGNSSSGDGIILISDNNTLTNNIGTSFSSRGIILSSTKGNVLKNNTAISENYRGLNIAGSNNSVLINNTLRSNGANPGLLVESNSQNNTFINNTQISASSYGVSILYSPNNIFENENISSYSSNAIRIRSSEDLIFRDSIINSEGSSDVYFYADEGSTNNTFINCSYDTESINGVSNELIRKWYYQAQANYSNGTVIDGTNITAYNNSEGIEFSTLTGVDGYTSRQEVTEYKNLGGTRTYFNNYTINASLTGYVTESNILNFTVEENKLDDFFNLSEDLTPPTITWESPTPNDGDTVNETFVYLNTTITDESETSAWFDWDNSLVGYWGMDYTNSTHVYDNSSSDLYGSFQNGLGTDDFTSLQRGNAIIFDGNDDFIEFGNVLNMGLDDMTITFWMNNTDLSGLYMNMVTKGIAGAQDYRYAVGVRSSGNLFAFMQGDGGSDVNFNSDANVSDGTIYHVAVVFDRDENISIYINGAYDSGEMISQWETADMQSNNPFRIGAYTHADNVTDINHYGGTLDEVTILKRALSQEEVLALYNGSKLHNNFTTLPDGTYDYKVYAIDEVGNLNITENRNVTVDTKVYCSTVGNSGSLDSAGTTYTLTENITSTGTCLTVTADNVTIDCDGYWINYSTGGLSSTRGVSSSSNFNLTVKNCNIVDGNWSSSEGGRHGIYFSSTTNGTIFNSSMIVSNSESLRLTTNSNYNNITENYISSSSEDGINIYNSHNNIFTNNLANSSTNNALVVYLAHNNVFENHQFLTVGDTGTRYGIYLDKSNNTLFRDCVNISGKTFDVYFRSDSPGSPNNTFVNCSYNTEEVTGPGNELIRKWYYQAQANYSNGTAINGANVTAYNNSERVEFSALTGVDGYTTRQEVTEYVNVNGTRTYFNNYTINASLTGYVTESNILNFTVEENKLDDFFNLSEDTTPPTITWESPTPNEGDTVNETFVYLNTTITDESETSAWFDWDNSLVGYWSFDYYNSTGVFDNSSYGNFGTFEGSLGESNLTNSKRGEGLNFDGVNDYVRIGNPSTLNFTNENFSFGGWFKHTNVSPSTAEVVFGKGSGSAFTPYFAYISDDNVLRVLMANSNCDGWLWSYSALSYTVSMGEWNHAFVTKEGSIMKLYIDGLEVDSLDYATETICASGESFAIGAGNYNDGGTFNSYFNGSIDEVMVFNKSLSSQEVLALYNGTRLENNFTNLEDGTYDYSAYAIDAAGNLNISENRNVTIDTTVYCTTIGNNGVLDSAGTTYTLTENITSEGTCLTVTADNVTIDCDGYWINYSTGGASSTYGIYTNGQDNLTIKNCNVIDGNWSSSNSGRYGLYLITLENSLIYNTSVETKSSQAIRLTLDSYYNNLTYVNSTSEDSTGIGIEANSGNMTFMDIFVDDFYVSGDYNNLTNIVADNPNSVPITISGDYNRLINLNSTSLSSSAISIYGNYNYVNFGNGTSNSSYGVSLTGSYNEYNNIQAVSNYNRAVSISGGNNTYRNLVGTGGGAGIYVEGNNQTVYGAIGESINQEGIYIGGNHTLYNISGTSTTDYGVYMVGADGSYINNMTGISTDVEGIRVALTFNTTLVNLYSKSSSGIGLVLASNSGNNNLSNSTIVSTSNIALFVESNNNYISNNTIFGNNSVLVRFSNADYNIFYGNKIETQDGDGTLLDIYSDSGDNLFYYNNFTETTGYFIDNDNETNQFNTTVEGVPQGNYYFNITSLAIYDSDSEGWGDTGSDYPLNSTTWSIFWNGLGNDWGPSTTKNLPGVLNVTLVSPTGLSNNIPQNETFNAIFNVTCEGEVGASCGIVNGRMRYNSSSILPDTFITGGDSYDIPFYTMEEEIQSCGTLSQGDNPCSLSWQVNSTGDVRSRYLLDSYFNSSISSSNDSEDFEIKVISPLMSLTLSDELFEVDFGNNLVPGSVRIPAKNNSNSAYNVTCINPNAYCNVSIKGNYNFTSGPNQFDISNVLFNDLNDNSTGVPLGLDYSILNDSLPDSSTEPLYFWLDIPQQIVAGNYKTNFTIYAESV